MKSATVDQHHLLNRTRQWEHEVRSLDGRRVKDLRDHCQQQFDLEQLGVGDRVGSVDQLPVCELKPWGGTAGWPSTGT